MVITIERLPEWIQIQSDDGSSDHSPWLRLSPIDALMPSYHVPLLLAFSSKLSTSSRLKDSLQKVLGYYMELAGRIGRDESGDLGIRLNNEGVFWVEAVATETLVEFLGSDDGHGNLHKLTPMSSFDQTDHLAVPLLVQITSFSCGGFALGLGIQHHAADCNAVPGFLADWAALASGKAAKFSNSRSSDRTLMMPRDPPMPEFEHPEYALTPKHYTVLSPEVSKALITRRIHFRKGELDRLKNGKSAGGSSSTFVCLAAHLWRLITMARGVSGGRRTVLYCPVNGRRGLSLPVDYFGNAVFRARCEASAEDLTGKPLECGALIIAASIERASEAERLRSVVDFVALQLREAPKSEQHDSAGFTRISFDPNLVITSWARLPFYDMDFGSGAPILATPTNGPCEGYVRVVPSGLQDGSLEAVATLRQEHMKNLLALIEAHK